MNNSVIIITSVSIIILLLVIVLIMKIIKSDEIEDDNLTDMDDWEFDEDIKKYNKDDDLKSKDQKADQKKLDEDKIQKIEGNRLVKYDPDKIDNELENQREKDEDKEIVGLAEPVGRWTKFIMSQKIGYIKARMGMGNNKGGKVGFWVNLIKAQSAQQGKDQSRGR